MSRRSVVIWPHRLLILMVLAILAHQANRAVHSHDGHAPLPSKGATVQGIQLLLSEPARMAIGVEVGKVTLADLNRRIRAQGHVQLPWSQQSLVTTLVPGRIVKVMARPGEQVRKGQILALIESLELETIQRELLKAVSTKTLADRLLAQREELGRSKTIAMTTILENRRDVDESGAQVEVAIRKLLSLGLTEADIKQVMDGRTPIRSLAIRSPIEGEIESTNVRAGQIVATDEHLFHVVDLSEVEMVGAVIESDLPYVAIGQSVKSAFTSFPGQEFAGVIDHTRLAIDPKLRTLSVIVHLKNPKHILKPGMSGLMSIQVELAKQAIVCPVAAISAAGDSPFVFLERASGRYDRRVVKTGSRQGNQVEILDGLFPGDRVVITGTGLLTALFPKITRKSDLNPNVKISQESVVQTVNSKSVKPVVDSEIIAQGEVETPVEQRHFASSQVEGRVARILVHAGEDVKAGQILAEVESLPLHNLHLDLLQGIARLNWSREKTLRLRDLHERQVTSRLDLWKSETDLELTEQLIAEIRAKLRSLGLDQATLESLEAGGLDPSKRSASTTIPIRAPADGRLDHFEVVPGQVVRPSGPGQAVPSEPLFEIHDRAKLWVCAHVRERDASRLRTGLAATVTFPELPGKSVKGSVVRISPVFDPQARVMPVWIEVENADGRLYENMQARASIKLAKPDDQSLQNSK